MITTTNPYLNMSIDDLVDGIKKANAKARSKGLEMKSQMERAGHMLIELKRKLPHGSFMIEAARYTGLPQRNINRYMEMARGVIPHRTVGTKERETRKDRMINLIRATELLEDDSTPPKVDTVSTLPTPAPEKPARSSWVAGADPIDAEIMEPEDAAPPPAMPEDELDPLVIDESGHTIDHRVLPKIVSEKESPFPDNYVKAIDALNRCWDDGERVPWEEQMAAMTDEEKFQALGSYARMAEDKTLEITARRIRARAIRNLQSIKQ